MIRVLNLGAGVQSSTVLYMSCLGELPRLDHAVFADTGWEPQAVYDHLDELQVFAAGHGLPIHRVKHGNLRDQAVTAQVRGTKGTGRRWASLPLFTLAADGTRGMIRRQCTTEYKIRPIEQYIRRELLGLAPGRRAPRDSVEQWFGISFDEWQRISRSTVAWKTHCYPLVDRRITRVGCLAWLADRDLPIPPRSACIGCPYHSDDQWRDLKHNRPGEWQDAVAFDRAIRHCGGMRGQTFLHRSCLPLDEVDLSTDVDRGQLLLWSDECTGYCGT